MSTQTLEDMVVGAIAADARTSHVATSMLSRLVSYGHHLLNPRAPRRIRHAYSCTSVCACLPYALIRLCTRPLVAQTRDVTVGIKIVTKLRNNAPFIVHSIQTRYPGIKMILADDECATAGRTSLSPCLTRRHAR